MVLTSDSALNVNLILMQFDDFVVADCLLVPEPTTPSNQSCIITNNCLGFRCCLDIDLKIAKKSVEVFLLVDLCNFDISIGFGKWYRNISMFAYHWGTEEIHSLGNAIRLR